MLYAKQVELDDAVKACKALVLTLTDVRGLKVYHATRTLTNRKWEAIILSSIAAHGDFPDGIYPEGTQLCHGFGTSEGAVFYPPSKPAT